MFVSIHPVLVHPIGLMVSTNEGTVGKFCENKQTCLFVDIVVTMVRLQGNGHFEPGDIL